MYYALLSLLSLASFLLPATSRSPAAKPLQNEYSTLYPVLPSCASSMSTNTTTDNLTVDLGYAIYRGIYSSSSDLRIFKSMNYASDTSKYRFQKPRVPTVNRTVIDASSYGPNCPQSAMGGTYLTRDYILGSEDCLLLSVFAPGNASSSPQPYTYQGQGQGSSNGGSLPVFVWIHGGGYGQGEGTRNMTQLINANNNSFVAVVIQYRLGAFGFLSSDEVHRHGTANAGLYDQFLALQWVQRYISLFGGDPSRVTVAGQSAGAGSVMQQVLAFGGTLGDSLFTQAIAASPYLPMQYQYNDFLPTQAYFAFAAKAGCFNATSFNRSSSIFDCLAHQKAETLMFASANVSSDGPFGQWAFLPVIDGEISRELPSVQLQRRQVNGKRFLSGNNANEGVLFVPMGIDTEQDFTQFIRDTFPLFDHETIRAVEQVYPSTNASVNALAPLFATNGVSGPSALNQSNFATGQQQRANNLYAETTFVCPSYWLAEAFSAFDRHSWKYQFSVLPAQHASDLDVYFGPGDNSTSPALESTFMHIFGNFIVNGDPRNSNVPNWPMYSVYDTAMVNLNQTGGQPEIVTVSGYNTTELVEPGLSLDVGVVDAYSWEAGRGARCQFWRNIGPLVPE